MKEKSNVICYVLTCIIVVLAIVCIFQACAIRDVKLRENSKPEETVSTAEMEGEPDQQQSAYLNLYLNNPIDAFFDRTECTNVSTIGMTDYASVYYIAWKTEWEHAYETVREISPALPEINDLINVSKDSYQEFVENWGMLEAYYTRSDAFGTENGEYPRSISIGSEFTMYLLSYKAELYKRQTIGMYERFSASGQSLDAAFVFDAEKTKKQMKGLIN